MSSRRLLWAATVVALTGPSSAFAQGFTQFPSASGFSTQAFEDLWPQQGDYDFNDLVLRTHVDRTEDVNGDVTQVAYTFNVYALGASQCAAFALRLPGVLPSQITVDRAEGTANAADGAPWTLTALTPVSDGSGGSVLDLSPDVRADLCGNAPGFLNTVPGAATVACAPLGVRVTFDTPESTVPEEPGDLFYYRCGTPGRQIHRSIHGPIPGGAFATDTSLFDTGDDASGGGRHWVDDRGVPWALSFADEVYAIPAEGQRIDAVMTGIVAFAAGTGGADFWHTPGAGAFGFTGAPPPLPIAVFEFTASEQDLCDDDPFGIWADGACDCHLGGAAWAWNGTTCFDDEAGLCADWAGTWADGTCDCPGDLLWSGASCYDGADQRAAACVLGSQAPNNGTVYSGGGAWTGTTCDCSAAGVGYHWNGFGCTTDPSYGELSPGVPYEAACWDAGGVWQPWSYDIPSFVTEEPCDCSGLGPGRYFDGTACTDYSAGHAAACEDTGGFWFQGNCDCAPAGWGYWFAGTEGCVNGTIESPSAQSQCTQAGATWTGSYCDCSVVGSGQTWNGYACVGGPEYFCEQSWTAGTGWNDLLQTCDCSPWGMYWDSVAWTCGSYDSAHDTCLAQSGTWVGNATRGTCECGPDVQWDGSSCWSHGYATGCESAGGTWHPRAESNEEVPGWPGICDCPPGEYYDMSPDEPPYEPTCVSHREFECEQRNQGSIWTAVGADGYCDCNGGPQWGEWNGETCVTSYERRACESTGAGWWDPAAGTCQCNNEGTWDADLLYCQDATGEQNCVRSAGSWDPWNATCGCTGAYEAWDPALKHCVYSPERHGCEEDRRQWYQGGDPERPGLYACACESWNQPGYTPPDPTDWDWDPARVECLDLSGGKVSCQVDHYGTWTEDPEACNCASSTVPLSTWNPLVDACVYDPEVEACVEQPPNYYGYWDPALETCSCSGPDQNPRWEWDAQTETGACVGPQMEACQADPIAWWNEYNRTCECGNAPGAAWAYDEQTEVGSCTNPEYDDCIAEPGGSWGGEFGSLTCSCSDGESWYWQSDGQGGGFGLCSLTWDEFACLSPSYSDPPGAWFPTGGVSGNGYCDCDGTTGRIWASSCQADWTGNVPACEADPDGYWDYSTAMCDCSAAGAGATFNGSECSSDVEATCEAHPGATWTGETCDCGPGYQWSEGSQTCDDLEQAACAMDGVGYWDGINCQCGGQGWWSWDEVAVGYCTNPEYDACISGTYTTDSTWDSSTTSCTCWGPEPYWYFDPASGTGTCTLSGSGDEHECILDANGNWDPAGFCACDETLGQIWTSYECLPGDPQVQACSDDPAGSWDYQYNFCECADGFFWDGMSCVPW